MKWVTEPLSENHHTSGLSLYNSVSYLQVLYNYQQKSESPLDSLYYAQVDNNLEIIPDTHILLDVDHIATNAIIKIFNKQSSNIMVIENTPRFKNEPICNSTYGAGCNDIFIIESSTSGKSWLPIFPIPRQNLADAVHRNSPSPVFIEETGRIFIFYIMDFLDGKYGIGQATRPKDSKLFTNEHIIFSDRKISSSSIAAAYSLSNRQDVILHLAWYEDNGLSLMYSKSEDNGILWSVPTKIDYVLNFNIPNTKLQFITDPSLTRHIYLHYMKDPLHSNYIIESGDDGNSWSSPVEIPIYASDLASISLCGLSQEELYMFILGEKGSPGLRFGYYNPSKKIFQTLQAPFENMNMKIPKISCAEPHSTNAYKITVMATEKDTIQTYFAKNDIEPL